MCARAVLLRVTGVVVDSVAAVAGVTDWVTAGADLAAALVSSAGFVATLKRKAAADIAWGSKGKDARLFAQFCRLFSHMKEEDDRGLVLFMAKKMAKRKVV
jgi:hypothetical protein